MTSALVTVAYSEKKSDLLSPSGRDTTAAPRGGRRQQRAVTAGRDQAMPPSPAPPPFERAVFRFTKCPYGTEGRRQRPERRILDYWWALNGVKEGYEK